MSFIRDTLVVFRRELRLSLRNPAWVVIALMQPVLYLVLFGPLLTRLPAGALGGSGGAGSAGAAEAYRFFVPGLLIQLGLFGSTFVGFAIISDWRGGVIERFRVTPVSRLAVMSGRVLRDTLVLVVQAVILVLVGVAFGLRAPVTAVLISLGLHRLRRRRPRLGLVRDRPHGQERGRVRADAQLGHRPAGAAVRDHAAAHARAGLAAGRRPDQPVPLHHRRDAGGLRRPLRQHDHAGGRPGGGGPGGDAAWCSARGSSSAKTRNAPGHRDSQGAPAGSQAIAFSSPVPRVPMTGPPAPAS